jgi:phage shock protein A
MLTEKDIQKIMKANREIFATKEDFDKLIAEVVINREEIKDLRKDVAGLREAIQSLITSVDKLAKAIDDLHQEFASITAKLIAMKGG